MRSPIWTAITSRAQLSFFGWSTPQSIREKACIKIAKLWVPAAAIVDDQCEDEAKILQAEARHRLKSGKGIKVFSRPDMLKDWLGDQGLSKSPGSTIMHR